MTAGAALVCAITHRHRLGYRKFPREWTGLASIGTAPTLVLAARIGGFHGAVGDNGHRTHGRGFHTVSGPSGPRRRSLADPWDPVACRSSHLGSLRSKSPGAGRGAACG